MTRSVALFSGGHDSLVATHHAMRGDDADEVVHIDTGIGIPETQRFVRNVCDEFGWELSTLSNQDIPQEAKTYEEIVLEQGFPGPSAHIYCYTNLKERVLDYIATEADGKPTLYSGVRRRESRNRMGRVEESYDDGRRLWRAPLHDWGDGAVQRYRDEHDLPSNPVVENTHMSGECLCGAYACRDEELAILRAEYPEVADRVLRLEDRVQDEFGEDSKCAYWGWGGWSEIARRAATVDDDQCRLCEGCREKEVTR